MADLMVGLTGGLASGKSTVARRLGELGFAVVDADLLVRELYVAGGRGAAALAELLGPEVLDTEGAVDRKAVAAKIFQDREARRRVEKAIHPLVLERLQEIAHRSRGIVVYESAVLVASGHADACDLLVTIEAPSDVRLRRAVERGMDEADAQARLAAQGDGSDRLRAADIVLDNSGSLEDLLTKVDELATELRRRASLNSPGSRDL
ncbi:MAG: dephospho-CoA kinase [Thermoanaerobaculia bacterium]|nr:dephospho-CoA kinase [Thermoanaerobaculia bacterium]